MADDDVRRHAQEFTGPQPDEPAAARAQAEDTLHFNPSSQLQPAPAVTGSGRPSRAQQVAAATGPSGSQTTIRCGCPSSSSDDSGAKYAFSGQSAAPSPQPQNSMEGVRAERKRKKEAAAATTRRRSAELEYNPFNPAESGGGRGPALRAGRRRHAAADGRPDPPGARVPERGLQGRDQLTNDDVWRLGNEEFLNDSLFDYYLKYIVTTLEDSPEGEGEALALPLLQLLLLQAADRVHGQERGRRGGGKSPGEPFSQRRWTKNVDISRRTSSSCRSTSRSTGRSPSSAGRARSRT